MDEQIWRLALTVAWERKHHLPDPIMPVTGEYRKERNWYPSEEQYDEAIGIWFPSDIERRTCCKLWYSWEFPMRLRAHCDTLVHVACVFDINLSDLRRLYNTMKRLGGVNPFDAAELHVRMPELTIGTREGE